jgi:hypothetical protein
VSDLGQIFLLSLLAMFNPTLLAAVTLMLLLPNPKRLMLGYLLGAYTASISLGLVVVFALPDSSATSTSKNTLSPLEDVVVGLLLLLVAVVLAGDRDRPLRERRARRRSEKQARNGEEKEPLPMRLLGRGSPRSAFVVGLLLSFPGVSYLTGLNHIHRLDAATLPTVLLVVGFCLVQQLFLEVPLAGYFVAPEKSDEAVKGFRAWLARNGRLAGIIVAAVLGALVLIRGIAGLVS